MDLNRKENMRIACIIPTYNGVNDLKRLLESLIQQKAEFDTYIVDSSSIDGTFELAKTYGFPVHSIKSKDFNHGGTRQSMIEINPQYDIYVFLTQDAYLEDSMAIQAIVKPFHDEKVGAVCGRQLPHHNANPLASHARHFNYPEATYKKSIGDIPRIGIKAAFMSNSFSAYRKNALDSVGGFPKHVIFAEDMYVAAKMLMHGWDICYEGSAMCRHSHNYTFSEEFRRYFDMGVFHARETWIGEKFGGASGEGLRYVKSELNFLKGRGLRLVISSVLRNAIKLLAFKIGKSEKYLPIRIKKSIGMYSRYWDTPYNNP